MSNKQTRKEIEADITRQAKRLKGIEVRGAGGMRRPLQRKLGSKNSPARRFLSLARAHPHEAVSRNPQGVLANVRRLADQCKAEPERER